MCLVMRMLERGVCYPVVGEVEFAFGVLVGGGGKGMIFRG